MCSSSVRLLHIGIVCILSVIKHIRGTVTYARVRIRMNDRIDVFTFVLETKMFHFFIQFFFFHSTYQCKLSEGGLKTGKLASSYQSNGLQLNFNGSMYRYSNHNIHV